MPQLARALPPVIAAVVAVGSLTAIHPRADARERADAEQGIAFDRHTLPGASTDQGQRPVQPALADIQPWISAVGASVGSLDLRGQGLDGDACTTDPRDDRVRVMAVPGSAGTSFPTFELVAPPTDRDAAIAPIGCVPSDVDADGRPDVVVYYWGRSPVIFLNEGRGGTPRAEDFTPVEVDASVPMWNTTALNVVDLDGDGHLDLLVGNYFPDGARVLDETARDDERMAMQRGMGAARNAGLNRILLGRGPDAQGRPTFADASSAWPRDSAASWTLALGLQDLTGDGRPDMYVANDFGPDQLFVNTSEPGRVELSEVKGDRTMTTPRSHVMGMDSFKGMGVTYSWDEGTTELPNIVVSNITSPWALQEQNLFHVPTGSAADLAGGAFPYEEKAKDRGMAHSGWSWDIKPIDLTNSGTDGFVQATGMIQGERDQWPRLQEMAMGNDQILENPEVWVTLEPGDDLSGHEADRMWRWTGQRYVDVGEAAGFTTDEVSRGFSVADVNGDDRMDFLVAGQWGDSFVYLNESERERPAARLRVVQEGEHGPTPLVGARVTLTGAGYERVGQLFPANGHSGVSGTTLHFAVPDDIAAELTATVTWLDDGTPRSTSFPVDATADAPTTLEVPR